MKLKLVGSKIKVLRCMALVALSLIHLHTPELYAREVELSWEPFENTLGYQLQVSKQPNFKNNVLQKTVKEPGLTADLDIGSYFYRVRAIDKDKQPGFWSEPMKFEVTPYPPELKLPKSESSYTYYEIPPKIEFEWKSVDGQPEYELFIYHTTGKKAFEKKTTDLQMTVDSLTEGEYMWKVRTIYKKVFESPYGEPRRFLIEKKELAKPILVTPEKNAQLPAYQDVILEWKKDDATKYSDLAVSYKSSENEEVSKAEPPKNTLETSWVLRSLEPGQYKWRVRTKEGENTRGVDSEVGEFQVRKDIVSGNNWGFNYAFGYYSKSLESKSTKVNGAGSGKVQAGSFVNQAGAYYYINQGFGLQFDGWHTDLKQSEWDLPESGFTASARLRFGTPGFNQQFIFGFRQMNEYEIITEPSAHYALYSTNGGVVGTGLYGSIAGRYRLGIQLLYYKPLSYQETLGTLLGDVYEGNIGLSYNISYKFWASFDFGYQQSVYSAGAKDQDSSVKTTWNATRLTPTLRLSFEN